MVNEIKRRLVEVDKGLFILRYAKADDENRPPWIAVSPRPASNGAIEFMLHPDNAEAILWRPGACLVVRASAPGKLEVAVTPFDRNGSTAATVRIEPLSQGMGGEIRSARAAEAPSRRAGDVDDFRVLAHVASIGDVSTGPDQWIAGPSRPSRIEGFSLEWPGAPDGLDMRYSVKTARALAVSGQAMRPGDFAGTKGKALGLVGVSFEMSGPAADDYQFVAEAIFLGAPAMRAAGKRIDLAGPTGREPLVGLRVGPELRGRNVGRPARPEISRNDEPRLTPVVSPRPSGRVRVFRSSDRADRLIGSEAGR
jgi:hypothetical protein